MIRCISSRRARKLRRRGETSVYWSTRYGSYIWDMNWEKRQFKSKNPRRHFINMRVEQAE